MKRTFIGVAIGIVIGVVIANLPDASPASLKAMAASIGLLLGLLGGLLVLVGITLKQSRLGHAGLAMLVVAAVFIFGPQA